MKEAATSVFILFHAMLLQSVTARKASFDDL